MEILYDKPFCKISYRCEAQVPFILADWSGFSTSVQFRESCETVLSTLSEKRISRVVMDGGKAKVVAAEDQVWLNTDWVARATDAGYRTCAIVIPKDLFGQMSTRQVVTQADQSKVTIRMFDDTIDAMNWIVTT